MQELHARTRAIWVDFWEKKNAGEAAKTVAVPAFFDVRSGRDSNPRAVARKLISSQPRYDHFDTAAKI